MMRFRTSHALLACAALALTGCGHAPNIDIIGSFFPVWMLCVAIAVPLAYVVHKLLLRFDMENDVGPLALFYPCTVLLFTSLLWLIFFR